MRFPFILTASVVVLSLSTPAFAANGPYGQAARDGTHMYLQTPVKGQGNIVFNGDAKPSSWSPKDIIFNGRTQNYNVGSRGAEPSSASSAQSTSAE